MSLRHCAFSTFSVCSHRRAASLAPPCVRRGATSAGASATWAAGIQPRVLRRERTLPARRPLSTSSKDADVTDHATEELVRAAATAPPADISSWRKPYSAGTLSADELEQFWEEGYVIKHGLFSEFELEPVRAAIDGLVGEVADELKAAGLIDDDAAQLGFYERLSRLEEQFPGAAVLLHKRGVLPKAFQDLWSAPVLLSAAQQLVGPDIDGHPVWNLRSKVPDNEEATVPWHQDAAYLLLDCWRHLQATAWVPLIDANLQNGCLQVLKGGHRSGKVARHTCCTGDTWYVELDMDDCTEQLGVSEATDVVTCEVPLGSALFLNNLIPHRSLNNLSDNIRWSLDLRWQAAGEPNGFWNLKESIPMRRGGDESFNINWEGWADVNRAELQDEATRGDVADRFDTSISGPWMGCYWDVVHHNKHTKTYIPDDDANYTKA